MIILPNKKTKTIAKITNSQINPNLIIKNNKMKIINNNKMKIIKNNKMKKMKNNKRI